MVWHGKARQGAAWQGAARLVWARQARIIPSQTVVKFQKRCDRVSVSGF